MDYLRLKYLVFLTIIFISLASNAQEKTLLAEEKQYSYGFINISADAGIHQINDSYLKSYYNIRNAFQWNLGLELGNTASDFQIFLKYGRYAISTEFFEEEIDSLGLPTGNSNKISNEAGRIRFALGLTRTERVSKKSFLTLSSAFIYNLYNDNSLEIETSAPGMLVGIGYLYRGIEKINYFINLNYEYGNSKTKGITTDWSGLNLITGIAITIDKAD